MSEHELELVVARLSTRLGTLEAAVRWLVGKTGRFDGFADGSLPLLHEIDGVTDSDTHDEAAKAMVMSMMAITSAANNEAFIATDNVVMCSPKPEFNGFSPASLMFAARMLNSAKWRYSSGDSATNAGLPRLNSPCPLTGMAG